MSISNFEIKNMDRASTIGWLIFTALIVASLAGHYVFSPFIFGSAYYVVYVLFKWGKRDSNDNTEAHPDRLLFVGVIALLYLWFALNNDIDKRQFKQSFEKTCYQSQYTETEATSRLCENIQSHIDSYLYEESDYDAYNE